MSPIIRVKTRSGGSLVLDDAGQWHPQGHVTMEDLARARDVTEDYTYSPAHGYPDFLLAQLVARAIGGEAILPTPPPIPPGAIP